MNLRRIFRVTPLLAVAASAPALAFAAPPSGGPQLPSPPPAGGTATGVFAWTLVGPKAVLVNSDGSDFGTHGAGPTWTAADGSAVVGDGAHPVAKIDRPGAVPALLLAVTSTSGNGILTGVRYVRRSDTEGGLAPASGCDAAHTDATIARHYSAVSTFYR